MAEVTSVLTGRHSGLSWVDKTLGFSRLTDPTLTTQGELHI